MFKFLISLTLIASSALAQSAIPKQPKLVVVISLDQFRYDYLVRFREHFVKDGFNYLLNNGANFSNATFKHSLNMTGPGHAVLLTGSYGNQNGIISNDWYDVAGNRSVYCADDPASKLVGADKPGMSPANLIGSTFGDELRMSTSFRSKVISISNKDRAAVLMGGKLASAAYWMEDSTFVSSTYYMKELPAWVSRFNASGRANSFFGKVWNRILPENAYSIMDKDSVRYERGNDGLGTTFPRKIFGNDPSKITKSYYYALLTSPFGSELLAEFAKETIINEALGTRGITDLFCIGFSSNDYVGHSFGPNSHEVMDMTLRTDRILADLFKFIDKRIGLRNCLFVLTSDHGVAPIPEFILDHHPSADAGRLGSKEFETSCEGFLTKAFGKPDGDVRWVKKYSGANIYLNRQTIEGTKLNIELVARALADSIRRLPQIAAAYSREQMMMMQPNSPTEQRMRKSFHVERSGDVFCALKPYYLLGGGSSATSHGSPYDYDAHVPVILVGSGIRPGTYAGEISPADIGPTLSAILGVMFPAGRDGRVLTEVLQLR